MSSASVPSAMLAGIEAAGLPFEGRGVSIWSLTMPSTVASSKPPTSRAAAKASSRFGPIVAVVPAWASVWQTPHFCVKRIRPRAMSGLVVPQPEITRAAAGRAPSGARRRMGLGRFCIPLKRAGVYMSRHPARRLPAPTTGVHLHRSALSGKLARESGSSSAKEVAMQVRDGMSEVSVTVGPSHTLRQAAAAMVARNVGAALVIDDEAPTPGIVTERDLLLAVGAGEDPDTAAVGSHMTESVLCADPDWSLEHAAAEMSRRGIRHLVVFEGGEVTGILSMRDIVRVWTSDGATSEMEVPSAGAARR